MNTFPKILISIFLFIFTLQLVGIIFLMAIPDASQAADVKFVPQVGIGDDFKKGDPKEVSGSTSMIAEYIRAIYKYALGIVGILATVVMMFGGVLWITAGGNAERITNAKSWLAAALTGLVLALTSYMILYIVNPALVQFRITEVKPPGEIITSCCTYTDESYGAECSNFMTESQCEDKAGDWGGEGYICSEDKEECIKAPKCCQHKNVNFNSYYCEDISDNNCVATTWTYGSKTYTDDSSYPHLINNAKCNTGSGKCE